MKVHRIRMQGENRTFQHVNGPSGQDYTLCGLTLDGDDAVIAQHDEIEGRITCPKCRAVIDYCKSLRPQ